MEDGKGVRGYHPQSLHSRGRGQGYQPSRGYKSVGTSPSLKTQASTKPAYHQYGMNNHWANRCKTPKHLIELYQESIKG